MKTLSYTVEFSNVPDGISAFALGRAVMELLSESSRSLGYNITVKGEETIEDAKKDPVVREVLRRAAGWAE